MRVPQAVEENLRYQLTTTELDDAVEHALHWWIGTVLRFAKGREPSDWEEEEMRESLYDLAEEIEQEE